MCLPFGMSPHLSRANTAQDAKRMLKEKCQTSAKKRVDCHAHVVYRFTSHTSSLFSEAARVCTACVCTRLWQNPFFENSLLSFCNLAFAGGTFYLADVGCASSPLLVGVHHSSASCPVLSGTLRLPQFRKSFELIEAKHVFSHE